MKIKALSINFIFLSLIHANVVSENQPATQVLQACQMIIAALDNYSGIELCNALAEPHTILAAIPYSEEYHPLKAHMEMLADAWRLERVLANPERELELYWLFTIEQTKQLARIEAKIFLARSSGSSDELIQAYAEKADFVISYVKFLDKFISSRFMVAQYSIKPLVEALDENEPFLRIQEILDLLSASKNDRINLLSDTLKHINNSIATHHKKYADQK